MNKLPGKLYGQFFKFVVNSLLSAEVIFPEYKEKVDQMDGNKWYSWDEYCEIVTAISNRLGDIVTKSVGTKIVTKSKESFQAQGYSSADSILKDYGKFFGAFVKDTPPRDPPRTIEYEEGHAIIEAGKIQPSSLIEGYLTGIIRMFGNNLKSMKAETVGDVHRFEMAWK